MYMTKKMGRSKPVQGSDLEPRTSNLEPKDGIRLQKVIAASGLASRRKAEEWIAQGRVTINGKIVRELGTHVDPERDHVKVDGRHLKSVEPYAYLLLNKPKGIVSTLNDPEGRPTIEHLLRGVTLRLFPVGRLDFDTEGLMLLTNHGELAQALLHPRYHVAKVYLAKVKGVLTDEEIDQLAQGVQLEDGMTAPAIVKKVRKAAENSWLEVTIYEGRKHQIKRMFEVVGHPVLKLKRIKFGPLALGDLLPGEFRYLTDREANKLREMLAKRFEVRGSKPEKAFKVRGSTFDVKEAVLGSTTSESKPRTSNLERRTSPARTASRRTSKFKRRTSNVEPRTSPDRTSSRRSPNLEPRTSNHPPRTRRRVS
jgi:23S rRNA pseudouridine2605 synthase